MTKLILKLIIRLLAMGAWIWLAFYDFKLAVALFLISLADGISTQEQIKRIARF